MNFKSAEGYKKWLAELIEEDSKRFSNFRKKSKLDLPMSWSRADLYKKIIDTIFGKSCYICGFEGRLELAHLYYAVDSVKKFKPQGAITLKRKIEAIKHPERFKRLCSVCHDIFDYSRRNGGEKYLNNIKLLIKLSERKEANHEFQESRGI